jgi:hypothetical protein
MLVSTPATATSPPPPLTKAQLARLKIERTLIYLMKLLERIAKNDIDDLRHCLPQVRSPGVRFRTVCSFCCNVVCDIFPSLR